MGLPGGPAAPSAGGNSRVEFYRHSLGVSERAAVGRVMRGIFLTTGPETAAFEAEFAAYLGGGSAVGTASCTSAIHLSLLALGLRPGDEVITSPLTYVATTNAIVLAGGRPVFADVDPDSGLLTPAAAAAAVNSRTRAVIPVHLYGRMCDMRGFADLARQAGLKLVEDSAHCIEGSRDGVRPGQLSDAACFSFYATKNITAGEGGLALLRDPALAAHLRRLRNQGIDRPPSERHADGGGGYSQIEFGYKSALSDIQTAMLRPQLRRIDALHRRRRLIAGRYDRALAGLPDLRRPALPERCIDALHLYTVHVGGDRRNRLAAELGRRGIGTAVNYVPVHCMPFVRERFGTAPGQFPAAETIGARTLSLPFYPRLRPDEQRRVVLALREILSGG